MTNNEVIEFIDERVKFRFKELYRYGEKGDYALIVANPSSKLFVTGILNKDDDLYKNSKRYRTIFELRINEEGTRQLIDKDNVESYLNKSEKIELLHNIILDYKVENWEGVTLEDLIFDLNVNVDLAFQELFEDKYEELWEEKLEEEWSLRRKDLAKEIMNSYL